MFLIKFYRSNRKSQNKNHIKIGRERSKNSSVQLVDTNYSQDTKANKGIFMCFIIKEKSNTAISRVVFRKLKIGYWKGWKIKIKLIERQNKQYSELKESVFQSRQKLLYSPGSDKVENSFPNLADSSNMSLFTSPYGKRTSNLNFKVKF